MSAAVVRLPTAAPRKVKQPMTRARYAESRKLPKFPRKWLSPVERECLEDARLIREMGNAATLMLASAIFRTLDERSKTMVKMYCAMSAEAEAGQQACAWLRIIDGGTIGRNSLVRSLMTKLDSGEVE